MTQWLKLPGLFHRNEFEHVIKVDGQHEYLFEPAGHDDRGRELVAIYCRAPGSSGAALAEIPRAAQVLVARPANDGGAS